MIDTVGVTVNESQDDQHMINIGTPKLAPTVKQDTGLTNQ